MLELIIPSVRRAIIELEEQAILYPRDSTLPGDAHVAHVANGAGAQDVCGYCTSQFAMAIREHYPQLTDTIDKTEKDLNDVVIAASKTVHKDKLEELQQ